MKPVSISRFPVFAAMLILLTAMITSVTFWEPLHWRTMVMMRFMRGEVPDVKLTDLLGMLRPGSGISLRPILEGRTVSASVESPWSSVEDVTTGGLVFRAQCASCHGPEAHGMTAPSLRGRDLKHGASDWAVYRTIRDGIPGTAMAAKQLTDKEMWQVISYLKGLRAIDDASGESGVASNGANDPLTKYIGVTYRNLADARTDDGEWRMYSRTYDGARFSPLTQINTGNVGVLRLKWIRQLAMTQFTNATTPIVIGNIMFITEPPNKVLALNSETGEKLWSYERELPPQISLCCGSSNRGVGVLGDLVYVGTLDAHLVALNARTGRVVWDVEVAKAEEGYSITGAPLVVKDMVITGIAGAEFGIRGFIQAVDAHTGETRWRFYSVPEPDQPGGNTWSGDAWKTGGGSTWNTGSFDPDLNLVYWGVGNPSPVYQGDGRPGNNLYNNSVVALDATTGRLAWHFQFTPHDEHDWDSAQVPVLTTISTNGVDIPVLAWANKNGFYYVLDRRNGKFLKGVPFVQQNWAKGLDNNGQPILASAAQVSSRGTLTYPGVAGGTNWQPPAFDPRTALFFIHALEGSSVFSKSDTTKIKRRPHELFVGSGAKGPTTGKSFIRAITAGTGEQAWQYPRSVGMNRRLSGLMATAGGIVFGATGDRALALEAATGNELWSFDAGGEIYQSPITYRSGGQQIVVLIAGRSILAFAL